MSGVRSRVLASVVLVLTATLLSHAQPAGAAGSFAATGDHPTQGTPLPGQYLTADLGQWTATPDSYDFQWLRDGAPIAGATTRDYLVQPADIGHGLAPQVTGHDGAETASFVGTASMARQITSSMTIDVRRVHPAPGKHRLVWVAGGFLSTERPWPTDGGSVTAYRHRDGALKPLGRAVVTRGAAVVRLPWKHAPQGRTTIVVCFDGSAVVAPACSPVAVVHG